MAGPRHVSLLIWRLKGKGQA